MATLERTIFMFDSSLSDIHGGQSLRFDSGTKNIYPTQDGYLQNYPGRVDYFNREAYDPPSTSYMATPPSLGKYTRIYSFVDYTDAKHLVVVIGNSLYEVEGNGVRLLFVFVGRNIDGYYYPTLYVHQQKLIILNEGDYPLIWNGVDGVMPLGVQEVPHPVIMSEVRNIGVDFAPFAATDPYDDGTYYYHSIEGKSVDLGPALNKDSGGNYIGGNYRSVIQY